jgi:hypothetical protein
MKPVKHLIECRCILPQFRNNPIVVFHKFVVLSFLDDNDQVVPKLEACNNCGVIHKIVDFCKSTILNENIMSVLTISDIKDSLPEKLVIIFEQNNIDEKATWELAKYIIESELWGEQIILSKEIVENEVFYKSITILGKTLYDIKTTVMPMTV